MKLAIIFGGKSTEHNVSIVSATSIISNLNKNKYEIYPIYISKKGEFYKYTTPINKIKILNITDKITNIEPIDNITNYLKEMDIIFPVLHGLYGEDGTIQGLFELLGKKYVGCKVLSSSLCMDKIYTKILFERAKIPTSKDMYIKKIDNKYYYIDNNFNQKQLNNEELINKVIKYLKLPVFIKPSNSGSSVGVNKATTKKEIILYLEEAFKYDNKVLIEETIIGKEVECAILGNDILTVSTVGEIKSAEDFYTFNSKYTNKESLTLIPTELDNKIIKKVQKLAKKAYLACDCQGLARIDFFIENNTNKIIINEINTLPGFTNISMYPKLMEHSNINYPELLDKLIELAY